MFGQAHKILGRYQLLVAIARGGMGQVWLARLKGARGFSKLVAIKTLLPQENDLARLEGMLAEEARLAALIQHANVVHTMDLGEHEGMLYLVMEWVDGEPLGFLLDRADERGGMPLGVAVALVSQVLQGLHAVHELSDDTGPLGVVHRDVSPHNILVTYEGVAKLLDFGIAKATHQPSSNTDFGEVKGKFSFMSPEQILGGEVDRRCDVFAAGIVLYLLTTGCHPFKRLNTAAIIHAITTDEPVAPPSTLIDDYPAELERVLLRALEKDPEKRWPTAEDMRAALARAQPGAFGDAGRVELREFMERTVGDRKLARREAVRRAQLSADSGDVTSGERKAQQAGAQSVSSLRAISISQPAPADAPGLAARLSRPTPVAPPPRKRSARAPWLAASAGVLFALGALAPRFFTPASTQRAASVGVEAGTPLPVATSTAAAARGPTAPPEPVTAPAAPSPSAAPEPGPKTTTAPAASSKAPGSRPSKPARAADKAARAGTRSNDDLLAPDYTR